MNVSVTSGGRIGVHFMCWGAEGREESAKQLGWAPCVVGCYFYSEGLLGSPAGGLGRGGK